MYVTVGALSVYGNFTAFSLLTFPVHNKYDISPKRLPFVIRYGGTQLVICSN